MFELDPAVRDKIPVKSQPRARSHNSRGNFIVNDEEGNRLNAYRVNLSSVAVCKPLGCPDYRYAIAGFKMDSRPTRDSRHEHAASPPRGEMLKRAA